MDQLRYVVESLSPTSAVYHLEGRLHGTGPAYALQEEVRRRVGEGLRGIVIDLSGVERIDSSGIGILAAMVSSLRNAGGRLVLAGMNPRVHKLLDAMWFLRIVEHAPTVQDGVAALG
ncbi:MAG: STAS domain-containing protein [Acidobacteria bacterium]|nr:STAS domain-containing protein [Acidobacteriota bacterium]